MDVLGDLQVAQRHAVFGEAVDLEVILGVAARAAFVLVDHGDEVVLDRAPVQRAVQRQGDADGPERHAERHHGQDEEEALLPLDPVKDHRGHRTDGHADEGRLDDEPFVQGVDGRGERHQGDDDPAEKHPGHRQVRTGERPGLARRGLGGGAGGGAPFAALSGSAQPPAGLACFQSRHGATPPVMDSPIFTQSRPSAKKKLSIVDS